MRATEGFSMTGSCINPSFVPSEGFYEFAPSLQTSQMESGSERATESIQSHTKAFGPDHIKHILGLVFKWLGTQGLWSVTAEAQILWPVRSVPGCSLIGACPFVG